MNIEEARRSILRCEEDQIWVRLMQQFHRERGEVIRLQQRKVLEARKKEEAELRDAMYNYEAARSAELRQVEESIAFEKMQERQKRDEHKRQQMDRKRRAEERARKKMAKREALLQEAMLLRSVQRQKVKETEGEGSRRVEENFYKERCEYNRKHPKARTPFPESYPLEGTMLSKHSGTPHPTKSFRKLTEEDELQQQAEESKSKDRNLLELRRLQNLLAVRQKQEKERVEREKLEQEIEMAAKKKAEWQSIQEFQEKKHHYEMIDQVYLSPLVRRQREVKEHLNAINKEYNDFFQNEGRSPSSSHHEFPAVERMKEGIAEREENWKSTERRAKQQRKERRRLEKLEEEAMQRGEAAKREAEIEKKNNEEMVKHHLELNLKHRREMNEKKKAIQENQMKKEHDMAEKVLLEEKQEQAAFVEALKQQEKERLEYIRAAKEQRQQEVLIRGLEVKLENQRNSDEAARIRSEIKAASQTEQEVLRLNRKKAREEEKRHQLREREHLRILEEEARNRRTKAMEDTQNDRHNKIAESNVYREIKRRDLEKARAEEREKREAEMDASAAFYQRKIKTRKERVPLLSMAARCPDRSEQVVLPPHPELAHLERDTQRFMDEIAKELKFADSKQNQLHRDFRSGL